MPKITRLIRSNNAHLRLRAKHADTPGREGEIKYRYHNNVLKHQIQKNRVLTAKEKKRIYRNCES